jgi:nucleotide-binding universal stress UspA family protein
VEFGMHLRHVVAATDESAAGHHAALAAARLAQAAEARLTVLFVKPALSAPTAAPAAGPAEFEASPAVRELSRALHEDLTREAPDLTPGYAVLWGVPGVEIPRFAEDHEADLIVLGRKPRTRAQRVFMGDTADAVARRSRVPCLFVLPGVRQIGQVLACLDGTERGMSVYHAARAVTAVIGARLRVVTVEPVWLDEPEELAGILPGARSLRLNRTLDRVRFAAGLEGEADGGDAAAAALAVRRGDVLTEILAETQESGADLLVTGYHRGGPPGMVEGGSVARKLLHAAPCAVLTVPL